MATIKKPAVKKTVAKKTIKKAQYGDDLNSQQLNNIINKEIGPRQREATDLAYRKKFNGPQPGTINPISKEEAPFYAARNKANNEERWKLVEDARIKQKDRNGVPRLLKGRNSMGEFKSGGKIKKTMKTMKTMKNGGSLSGLTASNKRDKGIDPKGAYTTVQKRTLAGAKGKAKLTADKQLGATKMTAKRGMKISKKK
jgi:hypothetical protein